MGNDITATLPLFHFFPGRLLALFNPPYPRTGALHKLTGTFNHYSTSSYNTDELTFKKPYGCGWTSLVYGFRPLVALQLNPGFFLVDFQKSPSSDLIWRGTSRDFVARSAASRPS